MRPGFGKEQLCGWLHNGTSSILFINEPVLGIMGVVQHHPRCYTGVFQPIPGLISYAGATVRWGLLGIVGNLKQAISLNLAHFLHLIQSALKLFG